MNTRTQGEWTSFALLDKRAQVVGGSVLSEDQIEICTCLVSKKMPLQEVRMNAKLIAAAPDLLIALYVAATYARIYCVAYPTKKAQDEMRLIDQAIEKAIGASE